MGAEDARHMAHRRHPNFFFLFFFLLYSFTAAEGGGKWAPGAPLPRRAREIPPKAGISRVFINTDLLLEKLAPYSNDTPTLYGGDMTVSQVYHSKENWGKFSIDRKIHIYRLIHRTYRVVPMCSREIFLILSVL